MMKKILVAFALFALPFALKAQPFIHTQTKQQIYVLHGYAASIQDHWFMDFKQSLENKYTHVDLIAFPNSQHPDAKKWQQTLDQTIAKVDEHTYFVAHSLGVITLLHFLERHQIKKVGGIILVSGFSDPIPGFPDLDEYILANQINPTHFQHAGQTYMLISDNDSIVPKAYSLAFARKLNIPYRILPNSGHFLGSDGYTQFPQLVELMQQMLKHKKSSP
ncbi:MAG: alpha/beta hydrolase [Acinetobacter populi]|jgi:predicted alpha/beta hydrolase family esterase|uniref:RBBP9/YdeN family alpha/beta hydrolase n=1 Tax=Acinetobacter populi TaxID=1582270 RepID=UPI0023538D88|nr:alpha/beta hydrolase [Acinetobacter populi]MCH4247676.1 alpha/beta hydrolase [Acinetobacter populi]